MSRSTPGLDAVVVGAGPNGLVAAITLAAAGRSVHVVEASDTVGGGCRTDELTLPGFRHDVCATVHALGASSPAFRDLDLARHGVEWVHPDVPLAHPLDDGTAGVLHRSLDETARGLGPDGRAWRRVMGQPVRQWDALLPQVLRPIVSIPSHPVPLVRFGVRALQPATWLRRRFDTDQAAALMGGCAAHAFSPLSAPFTSSFGIMLAAAAHTGGWPFARGGSQAIADALTARLRDLGGTVETGRHVRRLDDLPRSRAVLFDTNPAQLASIAEHALPARFRARLDRFRHGPAAFKVDYALDGPVPWTNEDCRRAGTVHLGGTFDEIAAAEADVTAGRMPDRPFVLVAQQSVADSTRAPEGKHTVWAYAHVPHGFTGDATAAIERQIERFAPGFGDLVLARHLMPPAVLHRYNPNAVGGDIAGGAHTGLQLVFRPTLGLHAYSTPNPDLFLCSASTPPGGGVHGMCGRNAAERVLATRLH
ncbi:MAG: phytoene desaturase family protein [Ilumatobacteraceae bacterium]